MSGSSSRVPWKRMTPSPEGASAPRFIASTSAIPNSGEDAAPYMRPMVRTAPHPRDGVGHQCLVLAALLDGKRHEVELPLVAAELHRDAREQEGVLAGPVLERRDVKDADCGDRLLLVAEPAPPRR